MKNRSVALLLASIGASAVIAISPAIGATLVANGGFQAGTSNGDPYQQVNAGDSATISDWTVGPVNLDWIHGYWKGSSGSTADYSVDLSGSQHGSILQLISGLVFGQTYKLTFDTALNPDFDDAPQSLAWSLGAQNGVAAGTTDPNTAWTSFAFSFLWAGGSTATLLFATTVSQNNCCWGPALDNVALEAVPLPAALPLFAAGVGAMGYLAARRRRKAVLAA
jgi:choice-of-anchor C domain-containing protein